MKQRPVKPASGAGRPPDDARGAPPRRGTQPEGQPDSGALPPTDGAPPADAEQRPIGALAIVGFLTFTIMVFWYGMYALNLVRN